MIWDLCICQPLQNNSAPEYIAYFTLLGQKLQNSPSLLSGPSEILRIIEIISKGVLPQFSDSTVDDILYGLLHALSSTNLVDQTFKITGPPAQTLNIRCCVAIQVHLNVGSCKLASNIPQRCCCIRILEGNRCQWFRR